MVSVAIGSNAYRVARPADVRETDSSVSLSALATYAPTLYPGIQSAGPGLCGRVSKQGGAGALDLMGDNPVGRQGDRGGGLLTGSDGNAAKSLLLLVIAVKGRGGIPGIRRDFGTCD